ncbi:MAG: hypothetical protein Q9191_001663 [Dirinaria sp. TL-2023a]
MAQYPEREERHAAAMSWVSTASGVAVNHVVDGFPWGSIENGKVVDIGGSQGSVSIALARKFPSIKCIVQDRPDVVELGRRELNSDLIHRVIFMEHDFFKAQPVIHADVYLLRFILHNWSNAYAVRILRALVPALKDGARVLVMDQVIPDPNAISKSFDLNMWALNNAQERDLHDWEKLFKDADPGFRIAGVTKPEGSVLSIIEIIWAPMPNDEYGVEQSISYQS